MGRVLGAVDRISETVGSYGRWLVVALVLVGVFEVTMRHVFNAPTIWAYETLTMIGGSIYALGWAYALLHEAHVRVDIFFNRLPRRGQAVVDAVVSIFFFFPLVSLLAYRAMYWAHRAYARGEVMMESIWFPPAWPYKTILAVGFCLFLLQGVVKFVRDIKVASGGSES